MTNLLEEESPAAEFRWWSSVVTAADMAKLKEAKSPRTTTGVTELTPRLKVIAELERLAMVAADGLDNLRHHLIRYKAGDLWVPTGGIKKEDMDIPKVITILVVGFSGCGKSALINLMYSVLGLTGLIPFALTSGSSMEVTTMFLEEHNVLRSMHNGFCIYDSRGLRYDQVREVIQEVSQWMVDGVHHHQPCRRPGDGPEEIDGQMWRSTVRFVWRHVNCVMVVANIAEIYKALCVGDSKPLEATRELFTSPALKKGNQNPILILTHGDRLQPEDRIKGRIKICEFLGIYETTGVYDIACLTDYGLLAEISDPISAYTLMEAIYRSLLIADMSHLPRYKFKDKAHFVVSCLLGAFFDFLARLFYDLSQAHKLRTLGRMG